MSLKARENYSKVIKIYKRCGEGETILKFRMKHPSSDYGLWNK